MLNRGLFLDAEHRLSLCECGIPEPGAGELLIKIKSNGLCGSDIHFYKEGRLGNFVVTVPYIPGHEAGGTVAAAGAGVKHFKEGDNVVIEPGFPCGHCSFCKAGRYNLCPDVRFLSAPPVNGTFCDYIVIPESFAYRMPEGMTFDAAAIAEPAAVAVHAVNRAGFKNGADGVIVGVGPIGLLVLQAFKAAGGGRALCMDVSPKRLELASKLGADCVINTSQSGMPQNAGDVVFDTTGSSAVSAQLFSIAGAGATVVQVGWPAGNFVNMNIADFLDKELNYVGVNRYANAFPTAICWLADGRIKSNELISHRFPLSRAAEAFCFAAENPGETVKVIIYND